MDKQKLFNILSLVSKVLKYVFDLLATAKNKSLALFTGKKQDPPTA
jgi:hypothetical protein